MILLLGEGEKTRSKFDPIVPGAYDRALEPKRQEDPDMRLF